MTKKSFLKRFEIKELFGIYNVDIPFESNVNIFVGENGLGKTTILNCINYVLQCDSDNLYNIDFKEIVVTFRNNKKVKICHDDLLTDQMLDLDVRRRHLLMSENTEFDSQSIVSIVKNIYREIKKESTKDMDISNISMSIMRRININLPFRLSRMQIEKIIQEIETNPQKDWEDKIIEQVDNNIIYLPTYRRIEEDFNKCMNNDYKLRNDVMKRISNLQFGMNDVEQLIKRTCEELKNNTNEGFKEMTSNLLKNYVNMLKSKDKKYSNKNIIEASKLNIIFERLADKIDEDVKESIIDLLNNKDSIGDFEYKYLVTIIENLIEIYEKTRNTDESLNKFATVCNKYLENNTFVYNPFKIECNLIQEYGGEPIAFKNLSSGEKQIVSLFSKLYLSKQTDNIILFDEPELSLSILWQAKLLPDIINSEKCGFIIVITHSPFIFDNEFKENTKDIKKYITPIKSRITIA